MNNVIEEQNEIEELRRALDLRTAQLEATSQELEKLSYTVSHDLRAPLRAIEGFSKIILEDYSEKLDDEGKRYLKIIDTSSRKLTRLLDDLLRLSRLGRQKMNPQRVVMKDVVTAAWNEVQPNSARPVEFKIHPLQDAWGDPELLKQIWIQLLDNALKFTAKKEKAIIEITAENGEGQTIYRIKDNGIGFNMKFADRLFGVFQRMHSDEEFEGSGIGLAIVQRLVRRHSGGVEAQASPEEGASFSFTLPNKNI